jgi:hypothetical protein
MGVWDMKNYVSAFALLLPLALAGVGSALAAEECSVATLHGTYLFANEGFTIEGNTRGPFAVAGSEVFDGQGNVLSIYTISTNGKIARNVRVDGKYVVNADCTSTVTYSDRTRYDQFIAPDGSTLVFVQTNPGTVAAGFEPRATAQRVGD